jgi:D-alanyl-D-alanine carboxypeptidase
MPDRGPARTVASRTRFTILATMGVVSAALIGVLASRNDLPHGDPVLAAFGIDPAQPTAEGRGRHDGHDGHDRAISLDEADGLVPDGVTVLDGDFPAVANLDPGLLGTLRRAAPDAADTGVTFYVTSGWRSPKYQEYLFREAVLEYGSEEEAARWVASADTSAHVSGDAVDIGHADAMAWLSEHGASYGLCQIYSNEPWHFELRPDAIHAGCPPMYADPTHDPRMQK